MNLIAIDSAGSILSVAVSCGNDIFYKEIDAELRQSEIAMVVIDNVMKDACLKPCDLNGVLTMSGPGSFTGLRIGYSIAKGLALSLGIPFAAVHTLYNIEYPFRESKEKRGFARELLEIGKTLDFSDNTILFSGPEYLSPAGTN